MNVNIWNDNYVNEQEIEFCKFEMDLINSDIESGRISADGETEVRLKELQDKLDKLTN
jgi:hypothetical protein